MELLNETPWPARWFGCGQLDAERLLGVVVARATYALTPGGVATPDADTPLPVSRDAIATPWGELPGDAALRKAGVDLVALGCAYGPGGRAVPLSAVTLTVGDFARRLAVFGPRRWVRAGDALVPSAPTPFARQPLDWSSAYGGVARVDGLEVPNADNPAGKGYVLERAAVEGTALPELEDPAALIRHWQDRPRPIGLAPMPPGTALPFDLRTEQDLERLARALPADLYNRAHPAFRVAALRHGTPVELSGMTPDGPLRFRVPVEPLVVEVRLADRVSRFAADVDTLCLLPEARRFAVTYRRAFTYRYARGERRTARLHRAATTGASSC